MQQQIDMQHSATCAPFAALRSGKLRFSCERTWGEAPGASPAQPSRFFGPISCGAGRRRFFVQCDAATLYVPAPLSLFATGARFTPDSGRASVAQPARRSPAIHAQAGAIPIAARAKSYAAPPYPALLRSIFLRSINPQQGAGRATSRNVDSPGTSRSTPGLPRMSYGPQQVAQDPMAIPLGAGI